MSKMSSRNDCDLKLLMQLDNSATKPVAFTIRTNVAYDAEIDDDGPLKGYTITFKTQEFLHIVDKYDQNWWIGRLVKEGSTLGFVPSPTYIEVMRQTDQSYTSKSTSKNSPSHSLAKDCPAEGGRISALTIPVVKDKRNIFFKKQNTVIPPYDIVPSMRPIVIIGPSLKGYEVTDMMQKAIFDFLKRRFEGRIIITRVMADISLAKKNLFNDPSKKTVIDFKPGSKSRSNILATAQQEVDRIFELARTLKLIVLDCDTINHPSQLANTSLAPTLVYLKVSPQILQQLIKSRGKSQSQHLNVQLLASEKLAQCPPEMYDIIISENYLEDACEHISQFLESYWRATHPPQTPSVNKPHNLTRPPSASPNKDMSTMSLKMKNCAMSDNQSEVCKPPPMQNKTVDHESEDHDNMVYVSPPTKNSSNLPKQQQFNQPNYIQQQQQQQRRQQQHHINLLFNYVTSLLAEHPLEFDNKKYIFIKLLNDLRSLEKHHKFILTIQKRIIDKDIAEKYLGANINKSNNILIYYKDSQSKTSWDQILKKKKASIESKNKILNELNKTDLNLRMLQSKSKREIEHIQLKHIMLQNVLNSSLDVQGQLLSQNKKIVSIFSQMKSVEVKLQNRNTVLKSILKDISKSVTNVSKELLLESIDSSKKEYNMNKKFLKDAVSSESSLLNLYNELRNTIDLFNHTDVLKHLKPLQIFPQNKNLFEINWSEFLMNYNFSKENYIVNMQQMSDIVTTVSTSLTNLNGMESEFDENLKNTIQYIDNVRSKRDLHTQIFKNLDNELDELKNEVECIENIRHLDDIIQKSNTQLTSITKKKAKVNDDLQHSDLLFNRIIQKYTNQLNNAHQTFLFEDKLWNKPVAVLDKEIETIEKNHNDLLTKRKEIMMDKFNKKKSTMEMTMKEKSQIISGIHNTITSYKNKIKTYSQFEICLKDINLSLDNNNNDLLSSYHELIYKNHGKSFEQLKAEEIEFTRQINLNNIKIIKLDKEISFIENDSKFTVLNIKLQIEKLKDKLLQITNDNISLEMELNNKNTI
ncbi:Guanylate kinase/L-type calcium channel beta subunit,P-loop containing nucleoside triphosphate [Cinara cedri]|uniref:Guanylate kinase/L-type calcium channel beta subunit,P-loop containing nucleoside triphosphate n=1 Tax=Cinara cedri TaxID=506608 RepID=A0A5E4NM77_9HEMI|nr:Guanylate kinase/L-type calcium channel beta subunit,P-loop containing nucleoside triphosphate [Cinara cedri]